MANTDGSIVLNITAKMDNSITKTINALREKFDSLSSGKDIIKQLSDTIKNQKSIVEDLNTEYAELIAKGQEETPEGLEVADALKTAKRELNEFIQIINQLTGKSKSGADAIKTKFNELGKTIAQVAKRFFVFQVIYKIFSEIKNVFSDVLKSNEAFQKDWQELKAAFYTAVYPIVDLLIPALQAIINILKQWLVAIGQVAAAIKGITYQELVEQAKSSKEMADNFDDAENSSKAIKKNLAGFDEIEVLQNDNNQENGSSGGFTALEEGAQTQSMLASVMTSIGGSLAAVGLILLFHGQITWGLGFIVVGAAVWAITEIAQGEYSTDPAVDGLAKVSGEVGAALAAVGVLLLFMGLIPWGLGFIAGGAVLLGVHALAANWDELPEKTKETIDTLLLVVGTAALVLGILLCCTGVGIGLGIALIVLGATALVTEVALHWTEITNKIKEIFDSVIEWIKTYGLFVLGILLCLTGIGLPFGIALIILWAKENADKVELADVIITKVREIWEAVQNFWNTHIKKIFTFAFWLDLIKKAANGVISGVESLINGIIGGFESMLNWVVDGINSISFDVPDWLQWLLGEHFGFDIPHVQFGRAKLPRLAQGAVIPANKEFLAVLGDQKHGTNIETPLATMIEAFNTALDSRGSGQEPIHVHLYLDSKEIYNSVVNKNRENTRITGTNALAY